MNTWLKNHFQSDDLPPRDILQSSYDAACRVVQNPHLFPRANFAVLHKLIEEMETNPEICNLLN